MKIIYGKKLSGDENALINKISSECGILFDTARLLFYRGIDNIEKAKDFLNPSKRGFLSPFKLCGMMQAVQKIKEAKDNNRQVLVYGDYDADGVCATTVLYYCLKEFGITARFVVPEREEGYGLNIDKINALNNQNKIDLIITVDCGISDYEKIETLKNCGIEVIVTDHHEPPEILPKTICINPKIAGQDYGFNELCGAGVAYKLGYALIGEKADAYLDFVSLATVADSMELVGENRDITVEGLKLFNNPKTLRKCFKYLLGDNANREITAQTISYNIAPRINAGGRMGDADTALQLFVETDENRIYDLATKLTEYNIARQAECDRIYKQAKYKIESENLTDNDIILVADETWKTGFIGIVAAKLVEEFSRPVLVFAGLDGDFKGSARSVDGFNIYDAICDAKDLLIAYGGHSQAAGVAVSKDNFPALSKHLNDYVKNNGVKLELEQKIYAEWHIDKPISSRFAREIDALEPFGVGNRRPMFTMSVNAINSQPLKVGSQHYSFKTDVIEMLDFNGEKHVLPLSLPIDKKIIFEINVSSFKGKESVKGYVRGVNVDYGDFSQLKLHIFQNEISKIRWAEEKIFNKADQTVFENKKPTLYLLFDPDNLKLYPQLKNLPISLFVAEGKTSSVLVSPKTIPTGFEKIVYLDLPLSALSFNGKSYCFDSVCGYKDIDRLSIERSEFGRIFNKLINLSGSAIIDRITFVKNNFEEKDYYQALFVIEVLTELKILVEVNGKLIYDQKIKNALTNSKVYSKIYSLKV